MPMQIQRAEIWQHCCFQVPRGQHLCSEGCSAANTGLVRKYLNINVIFPQETPKQLMETLDWEKSKIIAT